MMWETAVMWETVVIWETPGKLCDMATLQVLCTRLLSDGTPFRDRISTLVVWAVVSCGRATCSTGCFPLHHNVLTTT